MDAAQQQPPVFHRRWKKRHKTPQAAAAALLLAAAAGLLVRAPNDDTGHPTKTYFFPVCTLDRPVSTLDRPVCLLDINVLTGYLVCSLACPLCTLGGNSARFQCAYWTRLPLLAGSNMYTY